MVVLARAGAGHHYPAILMTIQRFGHIHEVVEIAGVEWLIFPKFFPV